MILDIFWVLQSPSPRRGGPRRAECAAEDLGTTQVERDTMGLGALGALGARGALGALGARVHGELKIPIPARGWS